MNFWLEFPTLTPETGKHTPKGLSTPGFRLLPAFRCCSASTFILVGQCQEAAIPLQRVEGTFTR